MSGIPPINRTSSYPSDWNILNNPSSEQTQNAVGYSTPQCQTNPQLRGITTSASQITESNFQRPRAELPQTNKEDSKNNEEPTFESQKRFLDSEYRWTGHPHIKSVVTPENAAEQIKNRLLKVEYLTILTKQHAYLNGERFAPNIQPSDVEAVVNQIKEYLINDHEHSELNKVSDQVKLNMVRHNGNARRAAAAHSAYGNQYGR